MGNAGGRSISSVKEEVEKLQGELKRLRAMLRDADQGKVEGKESFNLWLQRLKNLVYDIEDVLDEFEYEDLRHKVESGCLLQQQQGRGVTSTLSGFRYEVSFCREMAPRLESTWRRIDVVLENKRDLVDLAGLAGNRVLPDSDGLARETCSFVLYPELYGRDETINKLISFLVSADDGRSSSSLSRPSVVSIIGMGGVGKTALAQYVYNNEQVKNHFPLRMWIHVSPDFQLKTVTKRILEHLGSEQNIQSLDVLQRLLSEKIGGKCFLLVLDDVWEENHAIWSAFSAPLCSGGRDSKILVTGRYSGVAEIVGSTVKIQLEDLSFDDSWLLFKSHALPGGDAYNMSSPLESIGKQIVQKLKGNPLALSTIGGLLRYESESYWKNVLENEIWELEQGSEGILPALRVSYRHLPMHLKPCFTYCCVFRKGCKFNWLDLVQLWMAQGYVHPEQGKPAEEVGFRYLNQLVSRCLVQFINGLCVVHDLLHDLGRLVLESECYETDLNRVQEVHGDVYSKRHMSFYYEQSFNVDLEVLHKFEYLRTLTFWFSGFQYINIPPQLFHKLKHLRVLNLSLSAIDHLPNSIHCLKSLRYLDLRQTKITALPDSLCTLYKLQTLILSECSELKVLPKGMSHLVNLHYLEAKSELVSTISSIGNLIHLQYLEQFFVSETAGNRIVELRYMNELRGKLRIHNLQCLKTKEDALEAALKSKQHLRILELVWPVSRDVNQIDSNFEESIIEGLQPPPQLKELTVDCYAGVNVPSWLSNGSVSILESLHLIGCTNFGHFPALGRLNLLNKLEISSCLQLKELPQLPPTVKNLVLRNVGLVALPNGLHALPLKQLILCEIPLLGELPLLPTTLKELTIESLPLQALPDFSEVPALAGENIGLTDQYQSCDHGKPQLSVLKIHKCLHLSLHEGFLKHYLEHLQVLSINGCLQLVNWPKGDGLCATLYSLKEELTIEWCPKLKPFPEGVGLHPSLKKLSLLGCPRVVNSSLFRQLHKLFSDDIYVHKRYGKMQDFVDETLQCLQAVDWLSIKYLEEIDQSDVHQSLDSLYFSHYGFHPHISFQYNSMSEYFSCELKTRCKARLALLGILHPRRIISPAKQISDANNSPKTEDDDFKLLHTCLQGSHIWASSLRVLYLNHIPGRAFTGIQNLPPLCLPSVETLSLANCLEMRTLPIEMLLSRLPALKCLAIENCPELTLSAIKEGIQCLPSLERLEIYECPKLLQMLSPLRNNDAGDGSYEDGTSSLPHLTCLYIDDPKLLTMLLLHGTGYDNSKFLFRDHVVGSIRKLSLYESRVASLMVEEAEGLMALASSLHCLTFSSCKNLEKLPANLKELLPNLKVLKIENCPNIRCLPEHGLPASLELLFIKGCPDLAKWYRTRPHQMATRHIPVVEVEGVLLQGSFSRFEESKAKWDFVC